MLAVVVDVWFVGGGVCVRWVVVEAAVEVVDALVDGEGVTLEEAVEEELVRGMDREM